MNEIRHAKFGMGAAVRRKEDNAFLKGEGTYSADVQPTGALQSFVLRSPYAHAKFEIEDISAAKEADGVLLILTGADVSHLKGLPLIAGMKNKDGSEVTKRDIPILCSDTVRHVGDAVAFIVADSVAQARDAAELIEIDYDDLPVIADTAKALDKDSPLVYDGEDGNLAFTLFMGDEEKTKAAFDKAATVSEIELINNRLVSNYMEPRACVGEYSSKEDEYTITVCSQGVHGIRDALVDSMGVDAEKIRVITPDVGGGFGVKVFAYREYPLVLEAAKILGKPVRWISDRTEHFVTDAHGRDNVVKAKMAMDENGKFLAFDIDFLAAMGSYLHCYASLIPYLGMTMTTGLYDIEHMSVTCYGVFTHTTPTDAYRGAGRPEAAYLLERLVDKCAFDMGVPVDEIRRRNFIQPDQLPYTTPANRMYDTGEFEAHMDLCMERSDWAGFDNRLSDAKANGKIRGIGMATYIEACAFAGSEPAYMTLQDDGSFMLRIGTQSNGQGHKTAYAQFAADILGTDIDKVNVHQGDTKELDAGGGTGGSRSIPLGGVSVAWASEALAEKMKNIAADELEASAGDIELDNGFAKIVGTDRSISYADIAAKSSGDDRNANGEFKQEEATYPNGTHICEIEVDPDTGMTEIIKYTIVDDFGVTVNPLLLAGQVHGGVVQSIGQCLTERVEYDDEGQLLTASFMDYCMPRADDVPYMDFETRNVPSTTNAMGIKGAGEAGTIGACPAVMNALVDCLKREYGIEHIDMPALPPVIWKAIQEAKGS